MENKFKRLAIISDCVHMRDEHGHVVTENHIYLRQMQALAEHFEKTVIVCPFVNKTPESVTTSYTNSSIDFIELPNAGGSSLKDKWRLLTTIPVWLKAFAKAYKAADIFYLRMPNNLNIPGFFYFYLKSAKTFATYTGTWNNYKGEPFTYRLQKWLLKHFFKGPVNIYINEKQRGANLFKTCSPSYNEAEWNEEAEQVKDRIKTYAASPLNKPVFITVGALVPNKNQQYLLEACRRLRDNGFIFYWYFVGDGSMRNSHEAFVKLHKLEAYVCIAGKKNYSELRVLYRKSNFLVQATLIEGFGKAPVEAIFHGVIPILSKTAMAEEMTGNGIRGYTFDTNDTDSLVQLITNVINNQQAFSGMIEEGRAYVKEQTLENWAKEMMDHVKAF